MDFKQYPSYKDSGVEWSGGVPEHWSITPLKFAIKNWRNGKWGYDVVEASDDNLVCVRVADFDRQKGVINTEKLTLRNYKGERVSDCLLNENHILIERSGGGENQLVGATVKFSLNIKAVCSNFISLLEIKTNYFDLDFIQYYFDHLYSLNVNKLSIKQTSGIQNLDLKQYVQNHISFPEIFEQTQIVSFLDSETSRIDSLIAKQEKLIEKLEEHRKSVISHAVTKGLDPNVKMKDSGVEWLGEVPRHWKLLQTRHIFNFGKGLTITKENLSDEGIPCINYGEVHSKYGFEFNPSDNPLKCVSYDFIESNKNCLLNKGDFIFADTSEDLEGSGNFSHLNQEAVVFAGYHTIIAKPKNGLNHRYLAYMIDSQAYRGQIRAEMKGVKVYSVSQGVLKSRLAWLPPIEEQDEIVKLLDEKSSKIDKLIAKQKLLIEKLKNHRTSIISHAVTGKIDVRDLVA